MVNRIYKKVIIAVLAISLSLSGIVSAGAAEKKRTICCDTGAGEC